MWAGCDDWITKDTHEDFRWWRGKKAAPPLDIKRRTFLWCGREWKRSQETLRQNGNERLWIETLAHCDQDSWGGCNILVFSKNWSRILVLLADRLKRAGIYPWIESQSFAGFVVKRVPSRSFRDDGRENQEATLFIPRLSVEFDVNTV